jgi:UDP-GlcNAc:undecaprenyl-phosphate GlcNAc-1-phosphate transferase
MNSILLLLIPTAASGVLAFCFAPFVSRLAVLVGAIDMPGERKIHHQPIPRLGGVAVIGAVATVWSGTWWFGILPWSLPPELTLGIGIGILPILLVSAIDDIRSMRAVPKFIAHIAGASFAVAAGISLGSDVHLFGTNIHIGLLAAPLSVLWIVGVTNAFNIIDGLDGLSAGLALISAASMAGIFLMVGLPGMACAALVLAGALAGFLPYNRHPARLFLGDTGATAIGFCLAAFALKGGNTLTSGFAALLPVFILGLPIADTLIAMARRALGRLDNPESGIFSADRNHIHHRLLDLGITHGRAVLVLYGTGLLLAVAAFASMFLQVREASMFLVALLLAGSVGISRLDYKEFALIKRGTILRIYEAPIVHRAMFIVFIDLAMCIVAVYLAVGLKADAWGLTATRQAVIHLVSTLGPLTIIVFWKSGMYRGTWHLADLDDLMRAGSATMGVTVLGLIGESVWSPTGHGAPLFLIYGLISLIMVTGSRASYVLLLRAKHRSNRSGAPVLVYGAGNGGATASRQLFGNPKAGLRPIGFIDDDLTKKGKWVNGLPVLGTVRELEDIVRKYAASGLLVATARVASERLKRAAAICERTGTSLFRMNLQMEPLLLATPGPDAVPGWLPTTRPDQPIPVDVPVAPPSTASAGYQIGPAAEFKQGHALLSQPCQRCGSAQLHRSHARSLYERGQKHWTNERLFRCGGCGWRGWLSVLDCGSPLQPDIPLPDLTFFDSADAPIAR